MRIFWICIILICVVVLLYVWNIIMLRWTISMLVLYCWLIMCTLWFWWDVIQIGYYLSCQWIYVRIGRWVLTHWNFVNMFMHSCWVVSRGRLLVQRGDWWLVPSSERGLGAQRGGSWVQRGDPVFEWTIVELVSHAWSCILSMRCIMR